MERKIIKRILVFNIFLASLLVLDLSLPGTESEVEALSSFYSATSNTGTSRKPIMETKGVVELLSGEYYRLGKLPQQDYKKGTKIKIVKSCLANNVNQLIIWDGGWQQLNVGVFSNAVLALSLGLSLLITSLNVYYTNKVLNIALIASLMFMGVISMVYFCCY
jgi:hypothetical protein